MRTLHPPLAEPAALEETPAPSIPDRAGPRFGPVRFTLVYLALVFLLPAKLVFAPLGAVGTPAVMLGFAGGLWWTTAKLVPSLRLYRDANPVRVALLGHAWFMVLTYALGHLRVLTTLEVTGSDRGLIALMSLTGTALIVADGIDTRAQLDRVLRSMVNLTGVMAGVGLIQFLTGIDPVQYIRVPGLSFSVEFTSIPVRSIFNRPYGTALHPIEFGVVCASVLPLAIHYTRFASTRRQKRWARLICLLIALGVPISVSRSAILCIAATLVILAAGWTWRQRANGLVIAVGFVGGLMAVIPGLVGTIRSLFVYAGVDPSITARQDRVPKVLALIAHRPWVGIGYGAYSKEDYFVLDNQIFRTAIESGILGVLVVLLLIGTAVACAYNVRRMSNVASTRHLAQALMAILVGVTISTYTFDAFFYRILTGTLFLVIGATGALWRLERSGRHPELSTSSLRAG